MKKSKIGLWILIFCALCIWQPKNVRAEVTSGKWGDNVTYTYDTTSRVLTLFGTGATYDNKFDFDEYDRTVDWYEENYIEKVIVKEGITKLGKGLFKDCDNLKEVVLPKSLQVIGESTFEECDCLVKINFPEGLQSIGERSFRYCKSLTSIALPNSVTDIHAEAFSYCESLMNVVIPNKIKKIEKGMFLWCKSLINVKIPDSVNIIGNDAFSYCDLRSVKVPDTVSSIGSGAFGGCGALETIVLPKGITVINSSTFDTCYALKNIVIPEGVQKIGDRAFCQCFSLKEITIPKRVGSIGKEAFANCRELRKITVKNKKMVFDSNCLSYNSVGSNKNSNPNIVIYGYKDSTAQKYGNKNNIAFQTIGQKMAGKTSITGLSSNAKGAQFQAKWKKVQKAYKYEVQIYCRVWNWDATHEFFRTFTKGTSVKAKKIKGLIKGLTYNVRVRAYAKRNGKQIIGPWSSVKKIKIKK